MPPSRLSTETIPEDAAHGRHALDLGPVVVTGGASGLGAAVARAVAGAGGTPVVLDVNAAADGVEHDLVDLSDPRAAEDAVREVAERHGGLGAVVTAAGIDACGDLSDVDAAAWDRVVMVNLLGTAAVVRAALPYLEAVHGRVVTVASTLGLRALPAATAYCASKFGVVGFTRALAVEVGERVGVTLLVPGGMRTRFFDDRDPQFKPGEDAVLQDADDVAATVLFALTRPAGSEVRELICLPPGEPSWP
jgi:NAD(P)-dependent dehydrogenase (short-subunit alcohol dehydrogenase family)